MTYTIAMLYLVMSVVTFCAYAADKRAAAQRRWRVSERTLHLLAACGGFPGALIAQRVLRHKTRKLGFQLVFWIITAIHAAAWLYWWFALRN